MSRFVLDRAREMNPDFDALDDAAKGELISEVRLDCVHASENWTAAQCQNDRAARGKGPSFEQLTPQSQGQLTSFLAQARTRRGAVTAEPGGVRVK